MAQVNEIIHKAFILATGHGATAAELQDMINATSNGSNYQPLADLVNEHLNYIASQQGAVNIIKMLATNGLGLDLSNADATYWAGQVESGQMSWADIFVMVIENTTDDFGQTLSNRAEAADSFLSGLISAGAADAFQGPAAENAMREHLQSIDHTQESLDQAKADLDELAASLIEDSADGTFSIDEYNNADPQPESYRLADTAENLAKGENTDVVAGATAIEVTDEDGVSVAGINAIAINGGTLATMIYVLTDSVTNLSKGANSDVVGNAAEIIISNAPVSINNINDIVGNGGELGAMVFELKDTAEDLTAEANAAVVAAAAVVEVEGNAAIADIQTLLALGLELENITYVLEAGATVLGEQDLDDIADLVAIVEQSNNLDVSDVTVEINDEVSVADIQALLGLDLDLENITYALEDNATALGDQDLSNIADLIAIVTGATPPLDVDDVTVTVSDPATIAEISELIDDEDGLGLKLDNITYALKDSVDNLSGADAAIIEGAHAITVDDVTVDQISAIINNASDEADIAYTLKDSAGNLAEADAAIISGAAEITAEGNATVAEISIIVSNGGDLEGVIYAIEDTAAHILAQSAEDITIFTEATEVTANDVDTEYGDFSTFDIDLTLNIADGGQVVTGGSGDDIIIGGDGNDTITGGAGADTLTGGNGADIFVFNAGDTAGFVFDDKVNTGTINTGDQFEAANGETFDVITDFAHGQDQLDLDGIIDTNNTQLLNDKSADFITNLAAGDAHFVSGNYSEASGKFSVENGGTDTLVLYHDGDGNQGIVLLGVGYLSTDDFFIG